jgi:hypothetical protein
MKAYDDELQTDAAFIFLCVKNIFSQLFIGPRIPYEFIFESSFLCGTVSKALEKSKMAKSSVRLFAGDCILYRTTKSANNHQLLQEDLKSFEA